MVNPSPEVCKRIVAFLSANATGDLKSLCLTSKAFERAARPVLYRIINLSNINQTIVFADRIRGNTELGKMILEFRILSPTQYRMSQQLLDECSGPYWDSILGSLMHMPHLVNLFLYEPMLDVLPPIEPVFPFHLERCTVRLAWSDSLIRFLAAHRALLSLHVYENTDDERGSLPIPQNCWPELHTFSGPLTSAVELAEGAAPHLRHLYMRLDSATSSTAAYYIPQLEALRPTLRSLRMLPLDPSEDSALDAISRTFPDLQYVGTFPLPIVNRVRFFESLSRFHDLRHLQVDISRWRPQPASHHILRGIVSQLKIYATSLRMVTVWVPQGKWMWTYHDGEWESTADGTLSMFNCNSWVEEVDLAWMGEST